MLVSDVIARLERFIEEHGNVEVAYSEYHECDDPYSALYAANYIDLILVAGSRLYDENRRTEKRLDLTENDKFVEIIIS